MQKYVQTHIIIKHKYLQNTATSQQYKVAHKNRIYHDKVAAQYYRYTKQHR